MTALLVRHAASEQPKMLGQRKTAALTSEGERQAASLVQELAAWSPVAIYSSPLRRAIQTAMILAGRLGLEVHACDALIEVDFGRWDGKTIDELAPLPSWQQFNRSRSLSRCPGGESMIGVQRRAVLFLEHLLPEYREGAVICISHADVIRAALCHYRGIPLDDFLSLEIAPASCHALELASVTSPASRMRL